MDYFKWNVGVRAVSMRKKMIRNSGFRCNVKFVNWTSVFVESAFETSLTFSPMCCKWQRLHCIMYSVDYLFSVTSYV